MRSFIAKKNVCIIVLGLLLLFSDDGRLLKKKNGVVPREVHQDRVVWTGETRDGASLVVVFFFLSR